MIPEPFLHLAALAAAGDLEACRDRLDQLDAATAERVVDAAVRAGIGPLFLAFSLRSRRHPDIAATARARRGTAVAADLRIGRTIDRLREALSGARIPGLFLKGACFRETLYPEPWMRPMEDVDLLVPRAAMREALATLRARGFLPARFDPLRPATHRSMAVRGLTSPDGVAVEVHGGLLYEPRGYAIDGGGLAGRAIALPGSGLPTPAWEDHVLQAAIHLARGGFRQILKHVLDLHRILATGRGDPEVIAARARTWGCAAALHLALEAARAAFATPVPTVLGTGLEAGGARGMLLRGLVRPGPTDGRGIGTTSDLPSLVVALLLDHPGHRAAFLAWKAGARLLDPAWATLFPERVPESRQPAA